MRKIRISFFFLIFCAVLSFQLSAQSAINISQDEECCPDGTTPTSRLGNLETCDLFATGGILTSGLFENRFLASTYNFLNTVLGKNGIVYSSRIAQHEAGLTMSSSSDNFKGNLAGVPSLGSDNIDMQLLEMLDHVYLGILKDNGDFHWRHDNNLLLTLETTTFSPGGSWENPILGPAVVGRSDLSMDTTSIPNEGLLAADGSTPLKFLRILTITSNREGAYANAYCLGTDSLIYSWGGRLNSGQFEPGTNTLFRADPANVTEAATPMPATYMNDVFTTYNTSFYLHDAEYDNSRTFWASTGEGATGFADDVISAFITTDGFVNVFASYVQNGQTPHRLQCPNGEKAIAVQGYQAEDPGWQSFFIISDAGNLYPCPWYSGSIPTTPTTTTLSTSDNRFDNFGVLVGSTGEKIIDLAWEGAAVVLTDQGNVYGGKDFQENTLDQLDNYTTALGLPPIKRFIDQRDATPYYVLAETMDGYNIVFNATGANITTLSMNDKSLIPPASSATFIVDINGVPWPDQRAMPYAVLWHCINPWK